MRLKTVTVQKFKNIVEPQTVDIEPDVTGLVGKNEAGKTTLLKALHRLNPANGVSRLFNLTIEYPRWRLARDRRDEDLSAIRPVVATFELEEPDLESIAEHLPASPPLGTVCVAARTYDNDLQVHLECGLEVVIRTCAEESSAHVDDVQEILECESISAAMAKARELAKQLKAGEPLRAKAMTACATAMSKYAYLFDPEELSGDALTAIAGALPRFFYFSSYDTLPGECDLTALAQKSAAERTSKERTVLALLAHAGEKPQDFMDADYDSRKAELQAASTDLSRSAFKYWKQNPDLEVIFDTDNVKTGDHPNGGEITHRILKIELRDARHGGVETNFATRSTGFQWFFSFFAAFSEFQSSRSSTIVLLDEPGTSLHGEAQKDFVAFVFDELGASKQTLYTTHSQYMVDPARYEKLRAVHDRATRENPDLGVEITRVNLSADRDTILPVESALGYSISQHLFIGSGHHLAVEGSSDFVYLQRMSEHLVSLGKVGLDPRLAIIPVGGADNMPAFVALLGRRLKVSALIDGPKTGSKVDRVRAAARDNGMSPDAVIPCSAVSNDLPATADIEDLFEVDDYLRLYNWAFEANLSAASLPQTSEPILRRVELTRGSKFDHALPAHALTEHRDEFLAGASGAAVGRFEKLFELLNNTLKK